MSDRPPYYTATTEAAVEEALQAAPFGQRVFVERLWALGYQLVRRGGKR